MRWLFLFCFFLQLSYCFGCECPPIKPISKKLTENYNVIFYGKVDSISKCSKDGTSTAYFTTLALFKGAVVKNVKVDFDCSSACMMSFEKNEEWLIYAAYQRFDLLTVTICEHSRKHFSNTTQDFYSVAAQRSFEDEKAYLNNELGTQIFLKDNKINEQQNLLKPHNEQPSGLGKLGLLVISFIALVLIILFLKRIFKTKQ